jgi:hypothetical protein
MNDYLHRPESTYGFTAPQKHATPPSAPARSPAPAHEQIARRAYEIYINKGSQKGQCQQNWHQAERELRKQPATA